MRIMWLCNTPLSEVYKFLHINKKGTKEGWLVGISNELRKQENIDFYYVFPQERVHHTVKTLINNISFRGYYSYTKHNALYITHKRNEDKLKEIISQIDPDIIHIFGTEIHHTLECINAVSNERNVIVSIQGLVSECTKYYCDGIPLKNILNITKNGFEWDSILKGKYQFFRRGINEIKSLHKVNFVIGRTEWDRDCVAKINPMCKYYYCSETLRDIFYQGQWDIHSVERYSVLVSQGNYPIKGLHTLLYALPDILKRYPKTTVYVAGDDTFLNRSAYGKYVKEIIKENGLGKTIRFLGFLDEEEMYNVMHKTHVMVLPSNCENSPNSVGEAMLVGLPVIVSDVGGVSSVAHNRQDALFFKSCDYTELAKRVCAIFCNDRLAQKLSDKGKNTAVRLYDRKNNVKRLLEIYQKITEK